MIRSLFAQAKHQKLLQDLGLTRFLKFQGKVHLVHDGVDLVEVEDQISFAHFVEVFVEDLQQRDKATKANASNAIDVPFKALSGCFSKCTYGKV